MGAARPSGARVARLGESSAPAGAGGAFIGLPRVALARSLARSTRGDIPATLRGEEVEEVEGVFEGEVEGVEEVGEGEDVKEVEEVAWSSGAADEAWHASDWGTRSGASGGGRLGEVCRRKERPARVDCGETCAF